MDQISLVDNDELSKKIKIVQGQTNYTEEEAREKLKQFNFNEMNVIRDYLGINIGKPQTQVKSVNQAIYKEIRSHLDGAMREYRERVDKGEAKKVI